MLRSLFNRVSLAFRNCLVPVLSWSLPCRSFNVVGFNGSSDGSEELASPHCLVTSSSWPMPQRVRVDLLIQKQKRSDLIPGLKVSIRTMPSCQASNRDQAPSTTHKRHKGLVSQSTPPARLTARTGLSALTPWHAGRLVLDRAAPLFSPKGAAAAAPSR